MESKYTSTGIKLLHHPRVLDSILRLGRGTPISLQIAPTSRCNLKCSFCSNANRKNHQDLEISDILRLINRIHIVRTIEFTGGGDPTMYPEISNLIKECSNRKLGFITNGIALKEKLNQRDVNSLHWLRISMNSLDYVKSVDIPDIKGVLGFSYVMNDNTNEEILDRLKKHVKKYNPSYVRIVPNCQATYDEQIQNNIMYSKLIRKWGKPYFYQAKTFSNTKHCYWGYFKPFVLHDGYVYPCSSVVLNSTSDRYFNEKFRWCKMEDLPYVYEKKMESFDTKNCDHCVFEAQNNMIDCLMRPNGMEDFV